MSETMIGTIPLVGIILTAIGCWFYMLGGRNGKWKRRLVGSLFCCAGLFAETLLLNKFNLLQLIAYPLTIGYFTLGYGSDILWQKLVKRFIVVLASLTVGVLMAFTIGGKAWLLLPLQLLIAGGSVYLGVINPVAAAAEEFFICLLLTEINLMYPFVGAI